MVLLQNKLNLKVSQKQILTPGLVQMVSVLALNKLELKEMINAEIVENPVLEELESNIPIIDQIAGKEADRERAEAPEQPAVTAGEQAGEKKDPFEEIDFGSSERPSFENFLSKPGTLTDHLMWQLGAMPMNDKVRAAAELVIGNLNDDGYLVASDEELMAAARGENVELDSAASPASAEVPPVAPIPEMNEISEHEGVPALVGSYTDGHGTQAAVAAPPVRVSQNGTASTATAPPKQTEAPFTMQDLRDAIEIVR